LLALRIVSPPDSGELLHRQIGLLLGSSDAPNTKHPGRISDIVARVDDDTFMVLLPETPKSGGLVRAERLCRQIAESRFEGGASAANQVGTTLSAGVAAFPEDGAGPTARCAPQDVRGFTQNCGWSGVS